MLIGLSSLLGGQWGRGLQGLAKSSKDLQIFPTVPAALDPAIATKDEDNSPSAQHACGNWFCALLNSWSGVLSTYSVSFSVHDAGCFVRASLIVPTTPGGLLWETF